MISTAGLSASLALKLIDTKRDSFATSIEKNALNAREINAFRDRIGSITSAEDLVKDYEVYSFVMKAYDLEAHIFGKAMIKKVLNANPDEAGSLTSKMTDTRFRELSRDLGFYAPVTSETSIVEDKGGALIEVTTDQVKTPFPNFKDPKWVDAMVEKYVDQKIINDQLETNETAGNALYFQSKVGKVKSWYNVLADTKLRDFFYDALNLPSLASTDVDQQVKVLSKKFDISKLQDPAEQDKLIKRYTAINSAKSAQSSLASNPIIQLVSSAVTGQSAIVSLNLDTIAQLRRNRY